MGRVVVGGSVVMVRMHGPCSCRGGVVMLGLMDDRYQVAVKRVLRHEFHGIKAALSLLLANRLQHKNVLPYLVRLQ